MGSAERGRRRAGEKKTGIRGRVIVLGGGCFVVFFGARLVVERGGGDFLGGGLDRAVHQSGDALGDGEGAVPGALLGLIDGVVDAAFGVVVEADHAGQGLGRLDLDMGGSVCGVELEVFSDGGAFVFERRVDRWTALAAVIADMGLLTEIL